MLNLLVNEKKNIKFKFYKFLITVNFFKTSISKKTRRLKIEN